MVRRGITPPDDEDDHDEFADQPLLSFREFVDLARPRYRWYRHCEILADVLQRVADGELRRVMVFMPPRHGKSELVSRLFSAYWLYRFPHQWVGINSYGAELAYTLSRAARENFQRAGGIVKDDAAAVKHWETNSGGGMWAAGVGGPILGKGWHLGIIDDPVKNAAEANSEVIQASHREWYDSTFYTREEPDPDNDQPNGAMVIINQRWSERDLCGWLLEHERDDDATPERWHVVSLEAIKEETTPELPSSCTLEPDWRQPGEPLCPERRPLEKLERIRARNPYYFDALFQQRPRPRDGALFPVSGLPLVDACPRLMTRVRYWDKAGAAPGKGDWTVGVLMGRCSDGLFWVEDVVRGQWPADERNKVIKETAALDRLKYGRVRIYVERPPGLAKESADNVIKILAGYRAEVDPVSKDKVERAEPFSAQCRAGNVRVLKSPTWTAAYLSVMTIFPFGEHDDDVDASSGAFNKLTEGSGGGIFEAPHPSGSRRV
jgi:predicted phage terminase large subunit-like protein